MKTHLRRATAGLIAIACLSLGSLVFADAPKVGAAPPEIKAAGFLHAKATPPTLAGLKGKVVVVAFLATWNPPSQKLLPRLEDLHQRHSAEAFAIVGLTDEERSVVEPVVSKVTFPIGYGSASVADYGVVGRPMAYVIGGDGKVVWSGYPSPIEPKFEEAIDTALAAAGGGK